MLERVKNNKSLVFTVLFSLLFTLWMERNILFARTDFVYRILELIFTVCMTCTVASVTYYLVNNKKHEQEEKLSKYYIYLFVIQTIAFLPMYTQRFLYGDDLWSYATEFQENIEGGIYAYRPFVSFWKGVMTELSFLNIEEFRIANGMVLYLFGCVLFKYIYSLSKNSKLAFVYVGFSIASCVAVDCVAYASIHPITLSLLASSIGFIMYQKSKTDARNRYIYIILAAICLFTAFCNYQIGTPIVFVLYIIAEKYSVEKSDWKRFKQAFAYLVHFGVVAIAYLLFAKYMQVMAGMVSGQSARGSFVTSVEGILKKIQWFYETVMVQALMRFNANIFGSTLFKQNNMFYSCSYSVDTFGIVLTVILIILIIISIVSNTYKQKSWIYLFLCVVALKLSFYPFLILPESVFLTYYAIGIILLLFWYIFDGIKVLIDCIKHMLKKNQIKIVSIKKDVDLILGVFLFVVAIQGNNYAENAWVNYSRDSYEYLANSIKSEMTSNIDSISVVGNMGPYVGGHDYVIFAIQNILNELGYNPKEFTIAQSENGYYLLSFTDAQVENMIQILGDERYNQLLEYYTHDDMYARWLYRGSANAEEERLFLKECFEETGLIIGEDEDTISINLNGFYTRNPF